jgi:hypothetical protein
LKKENQTYSEFLDIVENETQELDCVFCFTGGKYEFSHEFLKLNPDCSALLWIFNARRFVLSDLIPDIVKNNLQNFQLPLHNYFSEDSILLRGVNQALIKSLIQARSLETFDKLLVEYPPIERYIHDELNAGVPVDTFWPVSYQNNQNRLYDSEKNIMKLTIPGTINTNVREYEMVLDICKELFPDYNSKLELIILGRPVNQKGFQIIRQVREHRSNNHNIHIVDGSSNNKPNDGDFIPDDTFHRVIAESDLLLNPLTASHKQAPGIPNEIRGTSKGTGIINDSIESAVPLLVPQEFEVDQAIQTHTHTYRTREDMLSIIKSLVNNKSRRDKLRNNAVQNAMKFDLDTQRNRLNALLKSV